MRNQKQLGKITMDRKIVEGLRSGKSLTFLTKHFNKGKGYIIKIKDLALEYGYIEPVANQKIFTATKKQIPPYPEALFSLRDGRSEKFCETDKILDPKKSWIKERIDLEWSPQTIFEELAISVPRSNFYRYLHRQNLMQNFNYSKNVIELIHRPAECLQVDWGKLCDVIDPETKKKKTIWIFIGILGYSRFELARVVEKLDYKTTISVLKDMFKELGGVPQKVTSDNPKVFVQNADEYEPVLNPAFERFASHYGFTIEALPPADPKKKGKVERMVPMKRRLFESFDLNDYSLEKAQVHINKKLSIANERRHGSHLQKPIELFLNKEAEFLKPLPPLDYEIETLSYTTIRSDGYVRFENKYYRVDSRLRKQEALVIGNSEQVAIYCGGRLLEIYQKITDAMTTKACKDHYKESWEKTLQDHGHYVERAKSIGPDVARFISIILARGQGFVDTRVVWGILSLDKKYSKDDVNKACLISIDLSQVNLRTVRQFLNLTAKPKEKRRNHEEQQSSLQAMGGKFARPISEYKNHLRLVTNNEMEKFENERSNN